mmetsp:Transcript_16488/g.20116  ORF Transcript_16488/g.20116 Transcript_16488/m.20116 type:complete len:175 (+) Transcript_16488:984-1508(+)
MAIKGARNLPKRKYKKGNKSSALQDIAAATLNLMKQDEFRVYIKFIANLHTFYISLHSDYFQKGNHLSENVPGYQGRLITKQYFLMSEDLEDCRNLKWKENSAFKEYVTYALFSTAPTERIVANLILHGPLTSRQPLTTAAVFTSPLLKFSSSNKPSVWTCLPFPGTPSQLKGR